MPAWILVPCLVSLRNEFNVLAPHRDKASDGSIGDAAHQAEPSDHNPDETGNTPYEDADNTNEVHAIDVDSDLNQPDWTMERAVQIVVGRHRRGEDDRLNYVIYRRRIWASPDWAEREYTGASPHTEHAHFSARYTTAQERDTSAWGLLEDDMPSAEEIAQAVASKLHADLTDPNSGISKALDARDAKNQKAMPGVLYKDMARGPGSPEGQSGLNKLFTDWIAAAAGKLPKN
jgi:hypothetical protein